MERVSNKALQNYFFDRENAKERIASLESLLEKYSAEYLDLRRIRKELCYGDAVKKDNDVRDLGRIVAADVNKILKTDSWQMSSDLRERIGRIEFQPVPLRHSFVRKGTYGLYAASIFLLGFGAAKIAGIHNIPISEIGIPVSLLLCIPAYKITNSTEAYEHYGIVGVSRKQIGELLYETAKAYAFMLQYYTTMERWKTTRYLETCENDNLTLKLYMGSIKESSTRLLRAEKIKEYSGFREGHAVGIAKEFARRIKEENANQCTYYVALHEVVVRLKRLYRRLCDKSHALPRKDLDKIPVGFMPEGIILLRKTPNNRKMGEIGTAAMLLAEEKHGTGIYSDAMQGNYSRMPFV